ncbi:MAG: hypothetical protein FMNOHCHN_03820 [Ignavibacteriaceae bacterium]|nr:hypothetical protein [Ignavibacteriaceae bacterium]
MSKEPIDTVPNPSGMGRPIVSEEQYAQWLEIMRPFLMQGNSIRYALDRTDLTSHKDTVYEKYRLGDWFADKIDTYRATMGEMVNSSFSKLNQIINDKIAQGVPLSREDTDILKFIAEKHRTSQPFFVTRVENAESKREDVGKILDRMETDYDELGRQAEKQILEANTPVQDQE